MNLATNSAQHRRQSLGMTLPEMLIAMAIFSILILGILVIHIGGQRMSLFARSKLGASDEARDAISKMISEIRSAGVVRVGNGSQNSFTPIASDTPQRGNALQVYPVKGSTNTYVRYFWDSADQRLKRSVNGSAAVLVVANSITNQMVFTAENFNGTVQSNNFNNRVIGLTLQFFQLQSPDVPVGPGCLYDFYQLRTKITRRALE
jgi:prepilin-type N-terminal cleavage/methylation domain-containing protein